MSHRSSIEFVKMFQQKFGLVADGVPGPRTMGLFNSVFPNSTPSTIASPERFVILFQQAVGLRSDGIAGPLTFGALEKLKGTQPELPPLLFQGLNTDALTSDDIQDLSSRHDIPLAALRAVLDVESSGRGFDQSGRPKMLFEPHIFWRQLGDVPQRESAMRNGVAYPRFGSSPYPKDSYPRLTIAMGYNEEAALSSASWGLGQVLGLHHTLCGYSSARAFVSACVSGEKAQLDIMLRFIVGNSLDDELRRSDWRGFARGYNGPAYGKMGYHKKLQERFSYWFARLN